MDESIIILLAACLCLESVLDAGRRRSNKTAPHARRATGIIEEQHSQRERPRPAAAGKYWHKEEKTFSRFSRSQVFFEKSPILNRRKRQGPAWPPTTKQGKSEGAGPPCPRTKVVFDRPRTSARLSV